MHFNYSMKLDFDQPVQEHHFTLKCLPADSSRQQICGLRIAVDPQVRLWQGLDGFGNRKMMGYLKESHDHLQVDVLGSAWIRGEDDDLSDALLMKYPTRLTQAGPAVREICRAVLESGAGEDFPRRVMEEVYKRMTYIPGSTGIFTTAEEAAQAGSGVCQDYAHIMLAVLRLRSIPCRYVCGMLEGEGQSHAWVEALSGGRWAGYDPTNCVEAGQRHIVISHGRDAGDCQINQGIFYAAGGRPVRQQQQIHVLVEQ